VALAFFENVEFTSITATMLAAQNVTGIVQFGSLPLDLIFQRKLLAFSAFSEFNAGVGAVSRFYEYMDVRFVIEQPLNSTEQFVLSASIPVGGAFQQFTNIVTLMGNTTTVSILPLPLKVVSVVINCHDVASANRNMSAHITLFWETKKRIKFIGDD